MWYRTFAAVFAVTTLVAAGHPRSTPDLAGVGLHTASQLHAASSAPSSGIARTTPLEQTRGQAKPQLPVRSAQVAQVARVPVDLIEAAVKTTPRYHVTIDHGPSGATFEGDIDEAQRTARFQMRRSKQERRVIELYAVRGLGYARAAGSRRWIRVEFPGYLLGYRRMAVDTLKEGPFASVREEGQRLSVTAQPTTITPAPEVGKRWAALAAKAREPEQRRFLTLLAQSARPLQVATRVEVSRSNQQPLRLVLEYRTQARSGAATAPTTVTFDVARAAIPPLPPEARRAPLQIVPFAMLFLRLPTLGGWHPLVHALWAQNSVNLVRDNDPGGAYAEVYDAYWRGPYDEAKAYSDQPAPQPPMLLGGRFGGRGTSTPASYGNRLAIGGYPPIVLGAWWEDENRLADFYASWFPPDPAPYFLLDATGKPAEFGRDFHHFGGLDADADGMAEGLPYEWFLVLREIIGDPVPVPEVDRDRDGVGDAYYAARDWGHHPGRIEMESGGSANNRLTFTEAIAQYNRYTPEGMRNAYVMLGGVIHLLQDQAEPDHSALIAHPGSGSTKPEAYDKFQLCKIRAVEALHAAFWSCATFSLGIGVFTRACDVQAVSAAAAAQDDCERSVEGTDHIKGFERLNQDDWRLTDRISKGLLRLDGSAIETRADYNEYFRAVTEFATAEASARGLALPLGLDPARTFFSPDYLKYLASLGSSDFPKPMTDLPEMTSVRGVIPTIDSRSNASTAYFEFTDRVARKAIGLSAGLIKWFHEIVNHPPFVYRVIVTQGGTGEPPALIGPPKAPAFASDPTVEVVYDAAWTDSGERGSTGQITNVTARNLVIDRDDLLDPTRDAYLYVALGPPLAPLGGKRARSIDVRVSGRPIELGLRQDTGGHPYYVGRIPAWTLWQCEGSGPRTPPGVAEITVTATDRSAHLGSPRPAGREGYALDTTPDTPARVEVTEGGTANYLLTGYDPGTDTRHRVRVRAGSWDVAFGTGRGAPLPAPSPVSVSVSKPTAVPAGYLMCVTQSYRRDPTTGMLVTITIPASCPGQWSLARLDGPPGTPPEVILQSPNEPTTGFFVRTTPATTRGPYTARFTYTSGGLSKSILITIIVTN